MTAPAIDTTTVELPAFEPECGYHAHVGDEPVTHFVSGHFDSACFDGFRCTTCLRRARAQFDLLLARAGYVVCAHCKRRFAEFNDFCVKVVPLS